MVIALLAVLSEGPIVNPISDDWKSTEGDRGGCIVASKGGRERSTGPGSGENHVADDDIADTRTATIDWTAARYILSVMKTQLSIGRLTVCALELTWPVILCARRVVTKSLFVERLSRSVQIARSCTDERRCVDFMSVTT